MLSCLVNSTSRAVRIDGAGRDDDDGADAALQSEQLARVCGGESDAVDDDVGLGVELPLAIQGDDPCRTLDGLAMPCCHGHLPTPVGQAARRCAADLPRPSDDERRPPHCAS